MQLVERIADALLVDPRQRSNRPPDADEAPPEALEPRRVRQHLCHMPLQCLDLAPRRGASAQEALGHPNGAKRPADPLAQAPVADLGDLQAATADVEHPAVAERGRVDRAEVARPGFLALVEDPNREARIGQPHERIAPVEGVADGARRHGDDLIGTRSPDGRGEQPRGPCCPLQRRLGQHAVTFAGRDAHRLAHLVHQPERPAVAILEHDQPEGVRSAVDDRQPMRLGRVRLARYPRNEDGSSPRSARDLGRRTRSRAGAGTWRRPSTTRPSSSGVVGAAERDGPADRIDLQRVLAFRARPSRRSAPPRWADAAHRGGSRALGNDACPMGAAEGRCSKGRCSTTWSRTPRPTVQELAAGFGDDVADIVGRLTCPDRSHGRSARYHARLARHAPEPARLLKVATASTTLRSQEALLARTGARHVAWVQTYLERMAWQVVPLTRETPSAARAGNW